MGLERRQIPPIRAGTGLCTSGCGGGYDDLRVLVLAALGVAGVVVLSGLWMIRETQAGLVVKRFGPPLPSGRIIALNGEAGYQARLLAPGWHFGLWRWQFKVSRCR